MATTTKVQIVQFLNRGSYKIKVPSGYSSSIQVYAWGAGGGASTNGVRGGSGGFVYTVVEARGNEDLEITVGGAGGTGGDAGRGVNSVTSLNGGSGSGGAGGGGGASAISLTKNGNDGARTVNYTGSTNLIEMIDSETLNSWVEWTDFANLQIDSSEQTTIRNSVDYSFLSPVLSSGDIDDLEQLTYDNVLLPFINLWNHAVYDTLNNGNINEVYDSVLKLQASGDGNASILSTSGVSFTQGNVANSNVTVSVTTSTAESYLGITESELRSQVESAVLAETTDPSLKSYLSGFASTSANIASAFFTTLTTFDATVNLYDYTVSGSTGKRIVACAAGGGGGARSGSVGQPGGRYPDIKSNLYWPSVSDPRWGSFINTYGIWPGGTGTKNFSASVYFPTSGTYTFYVSSDNNASWGLDGSYPYATSFTAFTSYSTQSVSVTAGYHTVNASISNPGDVGGWAMRILNPDTSELWHTRKADTLSGLNSVAKGGNGESSGGGGGAGYEYGGRGGRNDGGRGGQIYYEYGSVTIAGQVINSEAEAGTTSGLPGGDDNEFYPARNIAYPGYDGAVILVFTKAIQIYYKDSNVWKDISGAYVKVNGDWKDITGAWVKANGEWKPLITAIQPSSNRVAELSDTSRVSINLVVAANTTNYNLEGYLKSAGYVAGRSDITLTVNAGVTVRSTSTSVAALTIGGTKAGDTVNFVNNGTILGQGGTGGKGGEYEAATGSGYSYCFLPGTQIATPNGPVNIEDVKKGDLVYAYDIGEEFNNSAPLEAKAVSETYEHKWDGLTSPLVIINYTGGQLTTTVEHEILCQNKKDPYSDYVGFVRAANLAPGDVIYNTDGEELVVESVVEGPTYERVYNFEVEDFHTFVADGVRVHNGQINNPAPRSSGKNIAGRAGGAGGTALRVLRQTTITNNGTIAGGGGGGGGGGGPNGGGGGGGAGYGSAGAGSDSGSTGNAGTASAGGAGGSNRGGTGGALGSAGSAGTSGNSAGGAGGAAGYAVRGTSLVTYSVTGTITGPTSASAE